MLHNCIYANHIQYYQNPISFTFYVVDKSALIEIGTVYAKVPTIKSALLCSGH